MLGLLFTGGDGPPSDVVKRIFSQAMATRREVAVAAADSGLMLAEEAGIRPDWVIGDMDSLDTESRLEGYPGGAVLRHIVDKDYTDTELAFLLLKGKGCGQVWIIGGGGGRTDHLFGIRSLFEREHFPGRWITLLEDIYCIEAGTSLTHAVAGIAGGDAYNVGEWGLSLAPGALISVFPLGGGPWNAISRGLKWPLDGLRWDRGYFGLSNKAVNGDFSIQAVRGRFLVFVPGLSHLQGE